MEKLNHDLFQDPKLETGKARITGMCLTSLTSGSRCPTMAGADVLSDAAP